MLEFNFADASRKWLIPLEDNDADNDNAGERLPSPVPVPKVCSPFALCVAFLIYIWLQFRTDIIFYIGCWTRARNSLSTDSGKSYGTSRVMRQSSYSTVKYA